MNSETDRLMERLQAFHQWLPTLNPHLESTLSAVVDREVRVELFPLRYVSIGEIGEAFPEGLVGLSVHFTEGMGSWHLILSRRLAGALADLAILGDGTADYDESLHQEPLKEIGKRVLEGCESELAAVMGDEFRVISTTVTSSPEETLALARGYPAVVWKVEVSGVGSGEVWMWTDPHFLDRFLMGEEVDLQSGLTEAEIKGVEKSPRHRERGGEGKKEPGPPPRVKEVEFADLGPSAPAAEGSPRDITTLLDISLPITIELGRTRMLIRDVLDLGPGSVIELDKLSGEPVDIFVNDKKFARGEVVVVEENFGVRITELLRLDERLRSLK